MKKNKLMKYFLNGGVMAAVAAVGLTIYQIGTTPISDKSNLIDMVDDKSEIILQKDTEDKSEKIIRNENNREDNEEIKETGAEVTINNEDEIENIEDEVVMDLDGAMTDVVSEANATIDALNFTEDTLMEWPVQGNILIDYSMDQTVYFATLDQYRLSPAITIQAVEDAPVVSAVKGEISSIEDNAKTGKTVTMELGNGYQAVYGQLKDLSVSVGQIIEKGMILGYVNAPTKYYNLEGSNLYFAMRKDGKPVDPILYLP